MFSVTGRSSVGRVRRGRALAKRVRRIRCDMLEDGRTVCVVAGVPSSGSGEYIVVVWMTESQGMPRMVGHVCGCPDWDSKDAVPVGLCGRACKHVLAAGFWCVKDV